MISNISKHYINFKMQKRTLILKYIYFLTATTSEHITSCKVVHTNVSEVFIVSFAVSEHAEFLPD